MEFFHRVTRDLVKTASLGRPLPGGEFPLAWCISALEAGAETAPVLGRAAALLRDCRDSGGGAEFLRAADVLFSLARSQVKLSPAPAESAELKHRGCPKFRTASYRTLEPVVAALKNGSGADLLSRALNDGAAFSPALIPLWENAMESAALSSLAVRALAPLKAELSAIASGRSWGNARADSAALELADAVHGAQALPLFRDAAKNAPSYSIRARAVEKIGAYSSDPNDTAFIMEQVGKRLHAAALKALGRISSPGASGLFISAAEDAFARGDFKRLTAMVAVLRARLPAAAERGETGAMYAFFTRLLPGLICLPGDQSWLVFESVEAVAAFETPESAEFLESMLALACNISSNAV